MAAKKTKKPRSDHQYDEGKVKTLSSLDHIRTRTGMYIGRLGNGAHSDDGIYVLLKEVVDNGIDEFIMGYGSQIDVTIDGDRVTVRDYGRGIPLGKVVDCVSRINTGAKYNDDVFQFSVGLNGVGLKAVNALATKFIVRSHRDGEFFEATFKRGKKTNERSGRDPDAKDGTFVEFTPDTEIFKKFQFDDQHVRRMFRYYAYLNSGLRVVYNGERFSSSEGLKDLIDDECTDERLYEPFYFKSRELEFVLAHTAQAGETHYSFVNGQFTRDGGTHLSAFREGVLKAINEASKKKFDGEDARDGLLGAVSVRIKEPLFESQSKNKLGNQELRGAMVAQVKQELLSLFHRNQAAAKSLLQKVEENSQLRKELQSVRKLARERSKSVSIRVPQLKDCKVHLDARKNRGRESMIIIAEGQSAAGSIVSCRDPNTQAIFSLKGKPLNVCDLKRDALYKNDELYNLTRSLNIEDGMEGLRYHKVILATDADVDGLHIRNLLITFFLRFFPKLVQRNHVAILETPLFRVRNKTTTHYCYTEGERVRALEDIGQQAEITRFKGLGEISPGEFKAFIGPEMRLTPVKASGNEDIHEILSFYMGKNTPDRRTFIMDNLVVEEAV